MLRPNEVRSARPGDASGLALLLPRTRYEEPFILAVVDGARWAFGLGEGRAAFVAFEAGQGHAWTGGLVEDVGIELDETSIFDPGRNDPPLGSMVREGTVLSVSARPANGFAMGGYRVPLLGGLPACAKGTAVGFSRWAVTIGEGSDRRTLRTVDVGSGRDG